MKHTPGPWYPVAYAGFWDIQNDPHYGSKRLMSEYECKEAEANAKLCAAAPDMIEALEFVKNVLSHAKEGQYDGITMRTIDNAIKKATQ